MADLRRIHEPFVCAALVIALTAGFGLASVLVAAIGLHWPLGAWWVATVQAHGHAQLFGWVGLFVVGVGLYFLPRLRGTVLAFPVLSPWVLTAYVIGIALRVISQISLAASPTDLPVDAFWNALGRLALGISGLVELLGAALFLFLMAVTFRRARPLVRDSPILSVRPYLATSLVSFVLANILNALLCVAAASSASYLLSSPWDDVLVMLTVMGFILPMTFVFSLRNLPLFMRLAFPPKRTLTLVLIVYVAGLVSRLAGVVAEHPFDTWLRGVGLILTASSLLFFVWEFDVLLRRKAPWTTSRTPPPPGYVETRKATRAKYPDYGEYGRFELLILAAFGWLVFASVIAFANGMWLITTSSTLMNPDIERHALTLGFISLLICGMAVRMLPGFSGKRRVASPVLVLATFYLGSVSAALRVVPLLTPGFAPAEVGLGLSGVVGWAAIACLGANMWMTFRR